MKRLVFLMFSISLLLLFSGCIPANNDSLPPPPNEPASSETAELSTERIPTQEGGRFFSFQEPLPANLPPQIMVEDETAYRLALTIQNYLFYMARFTEPFQEISEMAGLLEAAIYHTSPLNLRFSYGVGEGFVCEEYPNHVITKLAEEQVLEGKDPSEFFYAADVRATAKILFGESVEYEDSSIMFYEYFPQQGIYIQFGDLAGPRFPYPQITAYSETESGYQCDAILAYALDKDIPIEIDGQILTKDTFDSLTATKPKYRYTFATQPDGRLVITGLQILN